MPLHPYQGTWPTLGPHVFIAAGAQLIGQVTLGERDNVWFNAVLRADIAPISIGARTNVQDNSTIHVDYGHPTVIGEDVTVAHGVTVHGSTIESQVLIGMGAVILTGCTVGWGSIIGAHTLLTEGKRIPPRSLVLGSPGQVVRSLTDEEVESILENARRYVEEAAIYMAHRQPKARP